MEDFSMRAIVIGVSLFVVIMTLTAIIMYFDAAKGVADQVSARTDIASSFDNIVNSDNFEATLTGVQIRSLINKYASVENVEINITAINNQAVNYDNINNRYTNDGGWLIKVNENVSIISEEKLNIIDPAWNCKVDKVENLDKIALEIKLNVKD